MKNHQKHMQMVIFTQFINYKNTYIIKILQSISSECEIFICARNVNISKTVHFVLNKSTACFPTSPIGKKIMCLFS